MLTAKERIALTADEGSFDELWKDMKTIDRLGFKGLVPYAEKLEQTMAKSGRVEAMLTGTAKIHGIDIALGVMDFSFFGGSMGVVVGEKVARLIELAQTERLPLVIFCASGGARMQEGALSLMQMAKTCGALHRFHEARGYYISIMTNPTTGGVTASFPSVADIILAEPGALIGFAGPRVIQTTLKQELPKGFQRSEFLLEKGQLDRIVSRDKMRYEIGKLLAYGVGRDPTLIALETEKA